MTARKEALKMNSAFAVEFAETGPSLAPAAHDHYFADITGACVQDGWVTLKYFQSRTNIQHYATLRTIHSSRKLLLHLDDTFCTSPSQPSRSKVSSRHPMKKLSQESPLANAHSIISSGFSTTFFSS